MAAPQPTATKFNKYPPFILQLDGLDHNVPGVEDDAPMSLQLAYKHLQGGLEDDIVSKTIGGAMDSVFNGLSQSAAAVFNYKGNSPPADVRKRLIVGAGKVTPVLQNAVAAANVQTAASPTVDEAIAFLKILKTAHVEMAGGDSLIKGSCLGFLMMVLSFCTAFYNAFGPTKLRGSGHKEARGTKVFMQCKKAASTLIASVPGILKSVLGLTVSQLGVGGILPEVSSDLVGRPTPSFCIFDSSIREKLEMATAQSLIISNAQLSISQKTRYLQLSSVISAQNSRNLAKVLLYSPSQLLVSLMKPTVTTDATFQIPIAAVVETLRNANPEEDEDAKTIKRMIECFIFTLDEWGKARTAMTASRLSRADIARDAQKRSRNDDANPTAPELAAENQAFATAYKMRFADLTGDNDMLETFEKHMADARQTVLD